MPVPGQPRNPFGQSPDRFDRETPRAVGYGDGPDGSSDHFHGRTLRGLVAAAGTIRELWKQTVGYAAAPPPFSWTANGPVSTVSSARGFQITRALRYRVSSTYHGAGTDNTRLSELHSVVKPKVRAKRVTVNAGQQRGTPVTRNRLTSFGSRVTPLQDRPNGGTK